MKKTTAFVLAVVALGGLLVAIGAQAQEGVDPRILAYDKGPNKIDVSKYPADMQAKYAVFSKKCVSCHNLARSINCEFATPDEWERYVKRMMSKAGKLISPDDGKQIYEFLAYDSKIRKKALYDKKMAEAPKN